MRYFARGVTAFALLALVNCAGLNISAAVTDANAVVNDISALSTALTNSVPLAKAQLINDAIVKLNADRVANAPAAQIVIDVTEIATLVGTSVPDFQAAIVSDEAVVNVQFKQLQADMSKLKADLGLAAKQPLASLRAQAATKAH